MPPAFILSQDQTLRREKSDLTIQVLLFKSRPRTKPRPRCRTRGRSPGSRTSHCAVPLPKSLSPPKRACRIIWHPAAGLQARNGKIREKFFAGGAERGDGGGGKRRPPPCGTYILQLIIQGCQRNRETEKFPFMASISNMLANLGCQKTEASVQWRGLRSHLPGFSGEPSGQDNHESMDRAT